MFKQSAENAVVFSLCCHGDFSFLCVWTSFLFISAGTSALVISLLYSLCNCEDRRINCVVAFLFKKRKATTKTRGVLAIRAY